MVSCSPAAQSAETLPVQKTSELFIRIIKTTAETEKGVLEMWNRGEDGRFQLTRTYEMCTWSGALGPKLKEGDGQSPEGFYFIRPSSLMMVHGDCVSIGCYAMTDKGIETIYAGVEGAFAGGQDFIRVHVFPFEMTEAKLAAQSDNPN